MHRSHIGLVKYSAKTEHITETNAIIIIIIMMMTMIIIILTLGRTSRGKEK